MTGDGRARKAGQLVVAHDHRVRDRVGETAKTRAEHDADARPVVVERTHADRLRSPA
jgi:hypothetical protein